MGQWYKKCICDQCPVVGEIFSHAHIHTPFWGEIGIHFGRNKAYLLTKEGNVIPSLSFFKYPHIH